MVRLGDHGGSFAAWQVRLGQKSRVVAYRDFGRKFEFIAGDFKPTAYHAGARLLPVK
jgi:hypothetical protein